MTVASILNQEGIQRVYSIFIAVSLSTHNIIYLVMSMKKIRKYERDFKEVRSSNKYQNTGVLKLLILGVFIYFAVRILIVGYQLIIQAMPFNILEDLIFLGLLFIIIYALITRPELNPVIIDNPPDEQNKYSKINLPEITRKKYARLLDKYMESQQAFLDMDLSIVKISGDLNIPVHHLSMTINIEKKLNFYNYVKEFRTSYSAALLRDEAMKNESILTIAFKSGFQSKNSFNKAFKTRFYLTPSEYRGNKKSGE